LKNRNSNNSIDETIKIENIAIYALTKAGSEIAAKLANNIGESLLIIPEKFKNHLSFNGNIDFFTSGQFTNKISQHWSQFKGHIFIMATGIVIRKIAIHLKDKTQDPAVVVCDEKGEFAISLLSGHIGGANRIAKFAASILNGNAVITTATDVQGVMAFDELAARNGWLVANPAKIKTLNSMLLEGKKIAIILPQKFYDKYYSSRKNIRQISSIEILQENKFDGAVILTSKLTPSETRNIPTEVDILLLEE